MHAIARRLPAVTALALAAILAVVVSGVLVRLVEARSLQDVQSVLRLSGYDWARVKVDGLQVQLYGTAPSEMARFRAMSAAGTVVDPGRIVDNMDAAAARVEAPTFSIEMLRDGGDISLIGLVPDGMDRAGFLGRVKSLAQDPQVTDLLESAPFDPPEGWAGAVRFGLAALKAMPHSKISVAADKVSVSGMADSAAAQRRIESDLSQAAPGSLQVALDISAPRPAITPFLLRFSNDPATGRVSLDTCAADTEEARTKILHAAVQAGLQGKADCTIGMGSPSPNWADAAVQAIKAVKDMGGGAVTISDADVTLVAPAGTPKATFDTVSGTLENALPDAFSLHASLTKTKARSGPAAPPDFVAQLDSDGKLTMRGKVADALQSQVIDGFARATFGDRITNAVRTDKNVPDGWSIRVMAALEAMKGLDHGEIDVEPDKLSVSGVTGDPDLPGAISAKLTDKLGADAPMTIDVSYSKKLDPDPGPADGAGMRGQHQRGHRQEQDQLRARLVRLRVRRRPDPGCHRQADEELRRLPDGSGGLHRQPGARGDEPGTQPEPRRGGDCRAGQAACVGGKPGGEGVWRSRPDRRQRHRRRA